MTSNALICPDSFEISEQTQGEASCAKYTHEHISFFPSFFFLAALLIDGCSEKNEPWSRWHHNISMSQSHALTPPWPSISFELSLQCNLLPSFLSPSLSPSLFSTNSITRSALIPPTPSLSLSLLAPLLGLPRLITVCSYKNKTHGWKDVQFWMKMRRHRFIVSFSPSLFSLSLSLTHTQAHAHTQMQ